MNIKLLILLSIVVSISATCGAGQHLEGGACVTCFDGVSALNCIAFDGNDYVELLSFDGVSTNLVNFASYDHILPDPDMYYFDLHGIYPQNYYDNADQTTDGIITPTTMFGVLCPDSTQKYFNWDTYLQAQIEATYTPYPSNLYSISTITLSVQSQTTICWLFGAEDESMCPLDFGLDLSDSSNGLGGCTKINQYANIKKFLGDSGGSGHLKLTIYARKSDGAAACDASCASCSGPGVTDCDSCNYLDVLLYTGECVEMCPPGFFDDSLGTGGGSCMSCDDSCATCSNAESCDTCDAGSIIDNTGFCDPLGAEDMISTECLTALTAAIIVETQCLYDEPSASYISHIYLNNNLVICENMIEQGWWVDHDEVDPQIDAAGMWESGPYVPGPIALANYLITYYAPMEMIDEFIVDDFATLTNHILDTLATETKTYYIKHDFISLLGGIMRYLLLEVRIHVRTDMSTQTEEFDVTATEIEKLCPGACCVEDFCEVFITPTATAEFTDSSYEGSALVDPAYEFGDPVFMRIFIDDVNFRNERRLFLEDIMIMMTNAASPPSIPTEDYQSWWDVGNKFLRVLIDGQKMGAGTYYYMLFLSLATEDQSGNWYKLTVDGVNNIEAVIFDDVNVARRLQEEKYAVYRQESQRLSYGPPAEESGSSTTLNIAVAIVCIVVIGALVGLIWKMKGSKKYAKAVTTEQKV